MRARRRGGSADARRALFATFTMACASAACASTAANATVEVSNATSTSGDLGDPLLSLARDPSLPRELRARVRAASRELADAGLATLAATALETYGGAAEVRRGDPTRPTPRYRNTHHSPSPPPLSDPAGGAPPRRRARRGDHRVRFRAGYVGRRRRPTRIRARARRRRLATRLARRRGPSPPEDGLAPREEPGEALLVARGGTRRASLTSAGRHTRPSVVSRRPSPRIGRRPRTFLRRSKARVRLVFVFPPGGVRDAFRREPRRHRASLRRARPRRACVVRARDRTVRPR